MTRTIADILIRRDKSAEEEPVTTPAPAEEQADPKSGMPLKGKVLSLINEQYVNEAASAEVYYALSAYFADIKLEGFAAYFRKAAEEERAHAMKFFDYLVKCNERIVPGTIKAPKIDFESPVAACVHFLKHEQDVTRMINIIADTAMASKDFYTFEFIGWFLQEQLEEVRKAEDLCKKMALVQDDRAGLLFLDSQLKG